MNDNEILQKVCLLPVHYRRENLSPIQLVQRSGYLDMPQAITPQRISVYLRNHPELIDAWEIWAADSRSASCKKVEGGYAVYPGPGGKPIKFKDKFEAWAEVVARSIRHIAKFS